MPLERLFDAELQFRPEMTPGVSPDGREGELVGSGDGTVRGTELRGTIRWTNFETPGERLCGMFPAGVIETEDGATVRFDARGWALRSDAERSAPIWRVAGGLCLETDDPRYERLGQALAVWEGEFDPSTGRATWRVYRPSA